eukprot:4508580-Pyramimonas_sp.AAC.1
MLCWSAASPASMSALLLPSYAALGCCFICASSQSKWLSMCLTLMRASPLYSMASPSFFHRPPSVPM